MRVGDAAVEAVRRVARATGATPFMVLLAALHVVLGRWAGTDDVVVGTPVAGRARREWETLVGCFVNTLALRTRSRPGDTVTELIDHVREVTIDGLANQAIGFEDVVEALALQRDVSSTPIYQVMLTVHTEPAPRLDLPGVTGTWVAEPVSVAKADLSLHAYGALVAGGTADEPELHIGATYRTALFDRGTIERLLGHLEQVLVEFGADPGRQLRTVGMLTAAEVEQLPELVGAHAAPAIPRARSVGAMVRAVAARHPARIAVSSAGRDLTYAELLARADRLAAVLQHAGVGRGDRVGLFVERSCDVVVGMLAAMGLGAAYVPVDPMYPDPRVAALVEGADVRAVISQRALAGRLPAGTLVVLVDAEPADGVAPPDTDLAGPDDVAYVLFTSGTTGRAQGRRGRAPSPLGLPRRAQPDGRPPRRLVVGDDDHPLRRPRADQPVRGADDRRPGPPDDLRAGDRPGDGPGLLPPAPHRRDEAGAQPAGRPVGRHRPDRGAARRAAHPGRGGLSVVARGADPHGRPRPGRAQPLRTDRDDRVQHGAVSAGGRVGSGPVVPLWRPFPGTRAHVVDAEGRCTASSVGGATRVRPRHRSRLRPLRSRAGNGSWWRRPGVSLGELVGRRSPVHTFTPLPARRSTSTAACTSGSMSSPPSSTACCSTRVASRSRAPR